MKRLTIALACAALAAVPALAGDHQPAAKGKGQEAAQPRTFPGQIALYQDRRYQGDDATFRSPRPMALTTDWPIASILIHPGERWQICERPYFRGACMVIDRSIPDARDMGIVGEIGSARLAPAGQ
jgi:hypothetical protein